MDGSEDGKKYRTCVGKWRSVSTCVWGGEGKSETLVFHSNVSNEF